MPQSLEELTHSHLRQGLPEQIVVRCSLRSFLPALALSLALLPLPLLALTFSRHFTGLLSQALFFGGTLALAMLVVSLLLQLHIYLQSRNLTWASSLLLAPGLSVHSPVEEGFLALLPAYEIAFEADEGFISLVTGEYFRRKNGWQLLDRFDWQEETEIIPMSASLIDIGTGWDAFLQRISAENTVRLAAAIGLREISAMLAEH